MVSINVTSLGYRGSIDDVNGARFFNSVGASRYGVRAGTHFQCLVTTGDRMIRVLPGVAWAHNIMDEMHTAATIQLAVDRGRLVRAALAIALGDLEARGTDSEIAQRLSAPGIAPFSRKSRMKAIAVRVPAKPMLSTRSFLIAIRPTTAAQPMANAAFYYLEPQASDGFVGWHVLDAALRAGLDSDLLVMGVLGGIVLLVVAWGVPHLGRAVHRA